jgi:DNA-binding NarL/FixJ family response regulator
MNAQTPKTQRVLELIAKGISAAVIAERLGIHRQRVHAIASQDRMRREKLAGEVVE